MIGPAAWRGREKKDRQTDASRDDPTYSQAEECAGQRVSGARPAAAAGRGRGGASQTQEPREGCLGVPGGARGGSHLPGPRRQTLAPGFVSAPRAWQAGCRPPPPSGSMRPEALPPGGRAERPCADRRAFAGRAGGPPAPSPCSPAAALSSGRLSWLPRPLALDTSLFLADHLPAFPGLSGIPSNSKHFLSSAGRRL